MKPYLLLFGIGLLSLVRPTFGQSTPTSFGPSLTLSDGQCTEVIPADTLRRIGRHAYSTVTGRAYRFGFQGQEEDDELNAAPGTSLNYEFRIHDPRAGRLLSIDPLAKSYPWNSPYAFSENRVIDRIELEGAESVTPAYFRDNIGWTTAVSTTSINTVSEETYTQQMAVMNATPAFTAQQYPQATVSQGGVLGSPEYQFSKYQMKNVVIPAIPFGSVAVQLHKGEEVTNTDLGIEIAGVLPFGAIFGRAFKVVSKSPFADGAMKEIATFLKNNANESVDIMVSRLRKSAKSADDLVSLHHQWIADPKIKYGDKWNTMTPSHQANVIAHWKQDIVRNEAYRDAKNAYADELVKEAVK